MRLIQKQDDDMLKAIRLSIKMTGKDKMSEYFQEKIQEGDDVADSWFYYGLNAWEMMNITTQSQEKHQYLVEGMNGFDNTCSIVEKHWPALLLRSLIRIMMSGDDVDEMCVYLLPFDYTVEEAYADLQKMLEYQSEMECQPYFFITYAILAKRELDAGRYEEAKKILIGGFKEIPAGRCPHLVSLISIPVIMCFNKLLEMNRLKAASRMKTRHNIMFPNNKIG